MKYGVLRYTSYIILVFGFLYMSWHMGRAFERDGDAGEGVVITTCRDTGHSVDCSSIEVGLGDFMHVYDSMTDELEKGVPAMTGGKPELEFTRR